MPSKEIPVGRWTEEKDKFYFGYAFFPEYLTSIEGLTKYKVARPRSNFRQMLKTYLSNLEMHQVSCPNNLKIEQWRWPDENGIYQSKDGSKLAKAIPNIYPGEWILIEESF